MGKKDFLEDSLESLSLEEGQKAAYNCALNLLANLHAKTGDLNKIKRFVKVLAFVNSTDTFDQQPQAKPQLTRRKRPASSGHGPRTACHGRHCRKGFFKRKGLSCDKITKKRVL